MKLNNGQIYNYAIQLNKVFGDEQLVLPVKPNFYIQKNKKILTELGTEIEVERTKLIESYEVDGKIPTDKMNEVTKKIQELVDIEQEVNIYTIDIDDLGTTSLTTGQMEALLFMIN